MVTPAAETRRVYQIPAAGRPQTKLTTTTITRRRSEYSDAIRDVKPAPPTTTILASTGLPVPLLTLEMTAGGTMSVPRGSFYVFACCALLLLPTSPAGSQQPDADGAPPASGASNNAAAEAAFNSTKELGTIDAWNAFLSNYPTGFYADLARAYVKKLTEQAPIAAPAAAPSGTAQEISCSERSRLRAQTSDVASIVTFVNTSKMYRAILRIDTDGTIKDHGNLGPGQRLTVETFVTHPWMIATGPGDCLQMFLPVAGLSTIKLGPMPADGPQPDAKPEAKPETAKPAKKDAKKETLVCAKNYKLRNGACVLVQNCGKNAYRSDEGDCYCKKNYEMRNGNCVWKQDKQGFEVEPWKKPGCNTWQAQCSQGNNKACRQYEATCQVN